MNKNPRAYFDENQWLSRHRSMEKAEAHAPGAESLLHLVISESSTSTNLHLVPAFDRMHCFVLHNFFKHGGRRIPRNPFKIE